MPSKHRIQFDLTEEALRSMDELKNQSGLATRAELVRNALRLYGWFTEWRGKGWTLCLKKGDEIKEVEVLF